MEGMSSAGELLHELVWGPWTLVLFLGVGIWFSIRLKFFQITGIRRWWRETGGALLGGMPDGSGGAGEERALDGGRGVQKEHAPDKCGGQRGIGEPDENRSVREKCASGQAGRSTVTAFQSACTALAATIGTGNIVGVATALTCGGPGALFWMWISAAIGMMTAYAETYLGQVYRYRKADGHWMCGPMVYMERGLKCPFLAIFYTALAVLASLGMGSMVQSNSVSATLLYSAGVPSWVSGVVVTLLTAVIVLGGIGRIARAAERLMPVSAGVYLFFSLIVIFSCAGELPAVFYSIFHQAFRPGAAAGGFAGFLMSGSVRYGLSRGVFSNEAGLGTLAVLHGAAEYTTPEQQGMWAMFEVFFDTIVICTLTALVILCTGRVWEAPEGLDGAALTAWCYSRRLGGAGEILVSAALAVFAFATIVAWYYLGRQTAEYLAEKLLGGREDRGNRKKQVMKAYTVLYLLAVFTGCICRLEVVWMISDLWNGLMAYPNLLALVLLSGQVRRPERDDIGRPPQGNFRA